MDSKLNPSDLGYALRHRDKVTALQREFLEYKARYDARLGELQKSCIHCWTQHRVDDEENLYSETCIICGKYEAP